MANRHPIRSYEYKNDYLFIVIRQAPEYGPRAYFFCSGISRTRFDPADWRKAGGGPNPAPPCLKQMLADAGARALKRGARTKIAEEAPCGSMTPQGDGWHRESTLLLENAAPRIVQALLEHSVANLVKKVLSVCAPGVRMPAKLPNPPALQKWLESLHAKNYRSPAPVPFASWRARV